MNARDEPTPAEIAATVADARLHGDTALTREELLSAGDRAVAAARAQPGFLVDLDRWQPGGDLHQSR